MKRLLAVISAVVALGAAAAPASGSGSEPAAGAQGRYSNFHLITKGPYPTDPRFDFGYVRDHHDVTHAIVQGSSGLAYATRAAGADTWTRRKLPDGEDYSDGMLALSPNGHRLYLGVAPCSVNVLVKRTTARNFGGYGPDSEVVSKCDPEGDCCTAWELRGLVALPHNRVAVLLNKRGTDEDGKDGIYVALGRPGGTWTRTRLGPSADYDQRVLLARDVFTGTLYVAAPRISLYTRPHRGSWSAPTTVTVPPPGETPDVTGLAAMRGQVWLAYQQTSRVSDHGTPAGPNDGIYLTHRSSDGSWSDPHRPFGSDQHALDLHLLADPQRRAVHALYVESNYYDHTEASGLYAVQHNRSGWTRARQLTHWWHDIPLHLAITSNGNMRYDFQRN